MTPNTCPFCDLFVEPGHTAEACRLALVRQRDEAKAEYRRWRSEWAQSLEERDRLAARVQELEAALAKET